MPLEANDVPMSPAVETDVTEDRDELEDFRTVLDEDTTSPMKLVASWSDGALFSKLICGVTVAMDPMLNVFTTGCSALARVARRLARRILFFDTLLAELFLPAVLRELLVKTSSVLSAGVSSTADALRFTPAVVTVVPTEDVGGSLSVLSQRFVSHSFNSSCLPCDVIISRLL